MSWLRSQLWRLPGAQCRSPAEHEAARRRATGEDAEPADSGEEPGADAAAAFSDDASTGAAPAPGGAGAKPGGAEREPTPEGGEGGGAGGGAGGNGARKRRGLTLKERIQRCLSTERERITFGKVRRGSASS